MRVEQAFAGTPNTTGWGGERLGRRHGSRARTSISHVARLEQVARRLRHVQIEHLDWRKVLDRYDHRDAVFYIDPPYVRETRKRPRTRGGQDYWCELTTEEHAELVERMLGLEAAVLVSGYDHASYRPLEEAGFTRHEFDVLCSAAARREDQQLFTRTEVVWRRAPDLARPALPGARVMRPRAERIREVVGPSSVVSALVLLMLVAGVIVFFVAAARGGLP